MVALFLYCTLGLLLAKAIWNVGVPYVLARRPNIPGTTRTGGISMAPVVDVALLSTSITLAFVAPLPRWMGGPWHTSGIALGAIGLSYIHLFVVGRMLGKARARRVE
jgi:hypothetical protein